METVPVAFVAVLGLGSAALAWYGVPLLHRLVQVHRLGRLCRRRRLLALTFDDGPGEHLTPGVLELLERFEVRASFFPLGRRAQENPSVLDRVVTGGHEVGCHGQDHLDGWRVSPRRALRDVRGGFETLAPWVARGGLYRPAHGRLTLPTWLWLLARGARIGWWTVDSGDTSETGERDVERVVERVLADGGVVLLHDFDGSDARRDYVLELTESLLRRAREVGLQVVTVGRLLEEPG